MTDYIMVYIVCSSDAEANNIGKLLVEKRLAACVNIFPAMQSMYWWEGKIQTSKEVSLFAKTTSLKFEEIKNTVLEVHSYDCPCVIAIPVSAGEENYLKWIGREVQ
ncbi:MAG: divalent-cation tolerance protein CutA [Bacteroidetes bacterium]|nr:divalent-cation tolerance protein CutA [Bacteroidota bacterium]